MKPLKKKYVTTVWLAGKKDEKKYPTLHIPTMMAKKYHIDYPCTIILVDTDEGILIKKYNDE